MTYEEGLVEIIARLRQLNAGNQVAQAKFMYDLPLLNEIAKEIKELEKKLQHQEKENSLFTGGLLERVLDNIPIDVAIFDQDFHYAFLNKSAVKDAELRTWMIGKSEFDYCERRGVNPKVAENRFQLYQKVIASGKMLSFREDLPLPNGNSRAFLRSLCPVFAADGSMEMMLGCGIEITSLVETEAELRIKNADLDKTNHELDHFVYRASHEMRGPIASIAGLLGLTDTESNSATMAHYLNLIGNCATKLDTFIREIVDYSINSRHELLYEAVPLHDIVQSVFQELRFLDPNHRVSLDCLLEEKVPLISDPIRIKMIVMHLLSNSIKYRDEGKSQCKAEIEIKVQEKEIEILVKDNGKGIRQEHQPKLFEMFFRATHDAFGSGLGLYIVAEVLAKLKGIVKLQSELGTGTVVTITIPNIAKQPSLESENSIS